MRSVNHGIAKVRRDQQCTGSSRALLTGFQWIRGIRSRQIALVQFSAVQKISFRVDPGIGKNIRERVFFEDWEGEP